MNYEDQMLNDSQLLALSTFVYRIDRAGEVFPGLAIGTVSENMRAAVLQRQEAANKQPDDVLSQLMTYADWLTLLDSIDSDKRLRSLEIDACDVDANGAKMLMLSDGQLNGYAVFAGTGAGEWDDNASAAYLVDSSQQLSALKWYRQARVGKAYNSMTACGHSKGGNKALYITVRDDESVDRAVAFDAQGFSRQFVQAYGDAVLANTEKITIYSLDNDYVNGLLKCIALHSRRIYIDGSHIDNPPAFHSPFSLFSPIRGRNGRTLVLGGQTIQGKFGRAFKDFSDFVMDNASDYEFRQICTCVGNALENILAPHVAQDSRVSRAADIVNTEGFSLFVDYLLQYFGQATRESTAADMLSLLVPSGKRGNTAFDDLAIGALETAGSVLKALTKRR